jgi:hypothetical protein
MRPDDNPEKSIHEIGEVPLALLLRLPSESIPS